MLYADVEYFGVIYRNAMLLNGRWYFHRRAGARSAFTFPSRVKLVNQPQPQPRQPRKAVTGPGAIFAGDASDRS